MAITAPNDLFDQILAFDRQFAAKTKTAGLAERVVGPCSIGIRPNGKTAATINIEFKAGHGMDRNLTTIVTSNIIDTPARRDELADKFVEHMELAIERAPDAAASRASIVIAAQVVFDEARAEGIDLELLRLEPAPIHVFGRPRKDDDDAQVFYVHVVMPHLSGKLLTRDSYTIDADDAEDFADYMRHRTLPELRAVIRSHGAIPPAA